MWRCLDFTLSFFRGQLPGALVGIQIFCESGKGVAVTVEVSGEGTAIATMHIFVNDPDGGFLLQDTVDVISDASFMVNGGNLTPGGIYDMPVSWRPVTMNVDDTSTLFLTVTQGGVPITSGLDDKGVALVIDANGRFAARTGQKTGKGDIFDVAVVT